MTVVQGNAAHPAGHRNRAGGRDDRLLRRDRRRGPTARRASTSRSTTSRSRTPDGAAAAGLHAQPGPDRRRRPHRHLGRRPRRHEPPQRVERRRLVRRHRPARTGMSAAFNPNPVPGAGTRTTLTLTAAEGAAHSDQYTEITVTATPDRRSGGEPALDHEAGPHPRELRPDGALRLRRRAQRELHGQAAGPLRGHERRRSGSTA